MTLPGVNEVEQRIGIGHPDSQRVTTATRFLPSGRKRDDVEWTRKCTRTRFVDTLQG
jgi:hypothetical protein